MDVPFHSSGAISRAHYAIVRNLETAVSTQTADQHIFLEIKSLKDKLAYPNISTVSYGCVPSVFQPSKLSSGQVQGVPHHLAILRIVSITWIPCEGRV
jgi:hypothetical protein